MSRYGFRTVGLAVTAAFLAMAGAAGTAGAATSTPSIATAQALVNRVDHASDPTAAFDNLSPADKKLFKEITTPYGEPKIVGATLPQGMMKPAYSGCWGHFDKVELQNAFGWKLADGYQRTNICASNGAVSSVWVDEVDGSGAWAYSYKPGSTVTTTYNAGWEGRGAVRFAYNVEGTGEATLCLRIFVNSNGYNWRTDHTCPAAA